LELRRRLPSTIHAIVLQAEALLRRLSDRFDRLDIKVTAADRAAMMDDTIDMAGSVASQRPPPRRPQHSIARGLGLVASRMSGHSTST